MNIEQNKLLADFIGQQYDYTTCDNCGKINPETFSDGRLTKCCSTNNPESPLAFYNAPDPDENGKPMYSIGKVSKSFSVKSEDLQYDSSWDWLILVVNKIESLKDTNYLVDPILYYGNINKGIDENDWYAGIKENHNCDPLYYGEEATHCSSKIEAVWQACVNFVNWYNKQTK